MPDLARPPTPRVRSRGRRCSCYRTGHEITIAQRVNWTTWQTRDSAAFRSRLSLHCNALAVSRQLVGAEAVDVVKCPMPRKDRYTIDLDWIWGPANRNLDGVATLRATILNPEPDVAAREVAAWLASLGLGQDDFGWYGGWSVEVKSRSAEKVALELTSGGQDAMESLTDAVRCLEDAMRDDGTSISWETLPIEHPTP